MKKYRFAFIANSPTIANLVKSLADPERITVENHLETMEGALPIARRLIQEGVEVILGGGAIGRLLLGTLDSPVVVIENNPLDLLRALIKAKNYGPHIGLICYANAPSGIELFEKLLGLKICPIPFTSTKELVAGVTYAASTGIDCVVGGGICKEIASAQGLEAVVVIPGQELILQSLEEAVVIATAQRKEREKAERLRTILESIDEGVIGVDERGNIDILNRMAANILSLDVEKAIGRPVANTIKHTGLLEVLKSGCTQVDNIRQIAGKDVVISSLPITIEGKIKAAIATFRLASRIQGIERKLKEKLYTRGFISRYNLEDLKGESPALLRLKAKAARYAQTNASLLIEGETGTGKEILAQAIHTLSPRSTKPFVAINCAALPESLLESELFGYEEGAFTGAKKGGKAGLFELAHGGTILLDEVADISFSLQIRLLRVLEEKVVMRVGGDKVIPVDVRVLSSTHKNIDQEVLCKNFRSDLRYRLDVLHLHIPPLRERKEDIENICNELIRRQKMNTSILQKQSLAYLKVYNWPGNVRQLDALLRRYILLLDSAYGDHILLKELMDEMIKIGNENEAQKEYQHTSTQTLKKAISGFEMDYIEKTLQSAAYSKSAAAKHLGISIQTLWRKMKKDQ